MGMARRAEDYWHSACHIRIFSRDDTSVLLSPSASVACRCLEWWGNSAPHIGAGNDGACVYLSSWGRKEGRECGLIPARPLFCYLWNLYSIWTDPAVDFAVFILKNNPRLSMMAHVCSSSTWEVEAGGRSLPAT